MPPCLRHSQCDLSAECAALTPHRNSGGVSPPRNTVGAASLLAFSRASPAACDWDPAALEAFGEGGAFDRSVSCADLGDAHLGELEGGSSDLSWFSAGLRVGLGIGFGVCLGAGIGAGILLNGWRAGRLRAQRLKNLILP